MSGTDRKFRVRGDLGGSREETLLELAAEEENIKHVIAPLRMEEDRSHMTERILNLTLEIIYLLTGERFPPLMEEDQLTFKVPPLPSLMIKKSNGMKILEVTKKMMELLTGEVPIRCQDVSVYFSMEEWEYLGGDRDLYKDVMMENEPPLTSPDGSSKRNPPERCPRPLYSRDPTQEDHTMPRIDQCGILSDFQVIVKEEIKEEDEDGVMEEEFPNGHKDLYRENMEESSSYRNPPERCPRPLYSRNPTQEGFSYSGHYQGEDLMKMKVEGEVEETYVRDDRQYTEEAGMMRTSIEEDPPTEISTGHAMEKPSKDRCTLSPGCKMEDEDITADCAGGETMSSAMDGGLHSVDRPWNPSDSEPPRPVRDGAEIQGEKTFSCPECGKCFARKSYLSVHQIWHTGEKPHSCPECEKCYSRKSDLLVHRKIHTGEKPYSCPECGKSFARKPDLTAHQRSHTGEKPFGCSECGKCYAWRSQLFRHQRSHTGEKPYSFPRVW